MVLALVVIVVVTALVFDYINGFHDPANSIATVVSTRVLSPGQAVLWAAFFNFAAAFLFGTAVAKTMGSGMIDIKVVTSSVILAGLIGAIVWDLITWYYGLPTSSSHALIGAYAGAAVAKAGTAAIVTAGWTKTLIFIVLAPLIGFALGFLFMVLIMWIMRPFAPSRVDRYFRKLQLLSAAMYSLGHGANDAQKTMGIIAGVLFAGGYLTEFTIPLWVVLAAHAAIALGTLSGGWRIIHTMVSKITAWFGGRGTEAGDRGRGEHRSGLVVGGFRHGTGGTTVPSARIACIRARTRGGRGRGSGRQFHGHHLRDLQGTIHQGPAVLRLQHAPGRRRAPVGQHGDPAGREPGQVVQCIKRHQPGDDRTSLLHRQRPVVAESTVHQSYIPYAPSFRSGDDQR